MKDFKGKVAVITGGAGGIGLGLARHCAGEGMKVVLGDVEGPALAKAEQTLKASGAEVLALHIDVSKLADVENLARRAVDNFGGVHLLFNNAGVQAGKATPLWESTIADWQWVMGVNLWGVIYGIKVFVPLMLGQKTDCHIVNTASIAGLSTSSVIGIYRITKAAIVMFSETLYLQLKEINASIGVTVACPSIVRTGLNEAERNRPKELSNPSVSLPTPRQLEVNALFQKANEQGIAPERFAELTFEAIRNDQLYLLTHPESNSRIKKRFEGILQGLNPSLQ